METYTNSHGPQKEALRIDPSATQSKADDVHATVANDDTNDDGHDDNVEPSFNNPLFKRLGKTSTKTTDLLLPLEKLHSMLRRSREPLLEVDTLEVGMSDQVGSQQQEGKPETIVGTRLGGDELAECSRDVLVGEGTLGDGLGEDGIRAGNAGADDQRRQEGQVRDGYQDAQTCADPHDGL